jgi:adenylate kinase
MKTFRTYIKEAQQRRIVMLGGPGSGKSTYTKFLMDRYGVPHIYPGGMLRKEVEKNTEIGKQIKDLITKGKFAPSEMVLKLIKDRIAESPDGYVLDGWPRYMKQVREMERENIGHDVAVFLDVSKEEVMKRLLARGRVDDTEEVINDRIKLYKQETGPVVEYFRNKPGFISIRAEGDTPENISKKIIREIENEKL